MNGPMRLLIADDEATFRSVLAKEMRRKGYDVEEASSGREVMEHLGAKRFDVLLLDLKMPEGGGLDILQRVREEELAPEVVLLTGHGSIPTAVEAIRQGAYDFLTKPTEIETTEAVCQRACERSRLNRENRLLRRAFERGQSSELLGKSPSMAELRRLIDRVSLSEAPVLILGESGTGKELVARAIHRQSSRADLPLVTVNCAALNASILESELFGHEKGAFTGADRARPGLFESADGGTIFLDEIGDMSLDLQARLLRVVQFGEVRRVGSDRSHSVDVRVLAATHREIPVAIREGKFREDLYYRLQTLVLRAPALRERAQDIRPLAEHFLAESCARLGCPPKRLSAGAIKVMASYAWPGNVRELRNLMERLTLLHEQRDLQEVDLVGALYLPGGAPEGGAPAASGAGGESLEDIERQHIARILSDCEGRKPEAAERLGISLKSLYNKLKKHGL
ncbi:MAG: sigma-54 dependent transcriptional regulator [Planctomycetota bacterium]